MLLGGSVEYRSESYEICELDSLGGVLPRCTVTGAVSNVSGTFKEPLVSEEDRSLAGLEENSLRKDALSEFARLGRVSSLLLQKSIEMALGSRTTPGWCGTADNLSMVSTDLLSGVLDILGLHENRDL